MIVRHHFSCGSTPHPNVESRADCDRPVAGSVRGLFTQMSSSHLLRRPLDVPPNEKGRPPMSLSGGTTNRLREPAMRLLLRTELQFSSRSKLPSLVTASVRPFFGPIYLSPTHRRRAATASRLAIQLPVCSVSRRASHTRLCVVGAFTLGHLRQVDKALARAQRNTPK
jgi:hypothetical protein